MPGAVLGAEGRHVKDTDSALEQTELVEESGVDLQISRQKEL